MTDKPKKTKRRNPMIIVKNATHARGHSGLDHMLDDTELEPIVGRSFNSVRDARKAAYRLSSGTRPGEFRVPITLEVLFSSGAKHRFTNA